MGTEFALVLEKAWNESIVFNRSQLDNDELADLVEFLLVESTHKTYKYILINGLLGGSAGHNPLCLQKSSNLANAWDARTVCHSVLVPFERKFLENRLGGSNEPFLNKPARFMELSSSNAVRGGNDKKALLSLIELFSDKNINNLSADLLKFALHTVRQIPVAAIITAQSKTLSNELTDQLLSKPCNGESLLFVTGLLLTIIYRDHNIQCHPSNQSGASSNEVGDIDIFSDTNLIMAVEVKDKLFSHEDFQHAYSKCFTQQVSSFLFVSRQNYIEEYLRNHQPQQSPANLISIESLYTIAFPLIDDSFTIKINDYSKRFVKLAKPKETTLDHINSTLKNSRS